MSDIPFFLISSLALGYCIGTIPFGLIIVALTRRKNICKLGNKRPGAANVFREIDPVTGVISGIFDTAKGAGTMVLLTYVLAFPEYTLLTGAIGALLGHNWPFILKFRGGEGVSITMGIYVLYAPGILGLMVALYLCFLSLWALKIKPFYLYHCFNWQAVFLCAPLLVYLCGKGWILSVWDISFDAFFLISVSLGLAGLLKQIQLYGVGFILKPSNFNNKYVNPEKKRLDKEGTEG
ncbi:glycerol-3-phosphate acyltransferase [Planctomycetota bacterium]